MASTSREATDLSAASNASKSAQILASAHAKCHIIACGGRETEPYNINSHFSNRYEFILSSVIARRCLKCGTVTYTCKICFEGYPTNYNHTVYIDTIHSHLFQHVTVANELEFKHEYIYMTLDPTDYGMTTIAINSLEILKLLPHIVCFDRVDYKKLFLEVVEKYYLRKGRAISTGITYMYIEFESMDYFIKLIIEENILDGYECAICGGEFECFPSVDVYREHSLGHPAAWINN